MIRILLTPALVLFSFIAFAQQAFSELDINNIRARVFATGDLFTPIQTSGFEAPQSSGLSTIYAGNLWVGGISPDLQLKLAAETYGVEGSDWFNGPLSIDGNAEVSDETEQIYDRVWKANSSDVQIHVAYFELIASGASEQEIELLFPNGYNIPEWILQWPAHGNISNGEAFYLAPFFDSDGNGIYDPTVGDYPVFCGDQCLFFIFNDKGSIHTASQAQPIGLEVHAMIYAFDRPDNAALNNTIFLKYKMINRSSQTLENTYAALWTDFDIGNPTDDFISTDVRRSALIAYNGDENDESSSGNLGYGDDLPAQALVILGGPFKDADELDNALPDVVYSTQTNSYGDYGPWNSDGIIDNERFGLSYSLAFNAGANPVNGEPLQSTHYYNYMRAIWKNGQFMNNGLTFDPMRYIYPGNSDPLNLGSYEVIENEWSEESLDNLAGDRKGICSMGPFTLMPDAVHYIDAAYVFARDSDNNTEATLRETLDNYIVNTRLFFNDSLIQCYDDNLPLQVNAIPDQIAIRVFPNPANESLTIRSIEGVKIDEVQIFNSLGKLVHAESITSVSQRISLQNFSNGIYTLRIYSGKNSYSEKLFIVK